jgi:hypothetical protein
MLVAVPAIPSVGTAAGLTISGQHATGSVRPGNLDHTHFTLRFQNGTLLPLHLTSLRITNLTSGPGTQAQRDLELGRLRLYRDDRDSVFEAANDALLDSAVVVSGAAGFDSFDVAFQPLTTTYLLVVGNLPLNARDGDEIHLSINASSDVTITPVQTTDNAWPVDPNSRFPIDGIVSAQVVLGPMPATTFDTGSRDDPVLHVVVPRNGYENDVLQGLAVTNLGSAQPGVDIVAIHAWADDGDGLFDAASDRPLGTLAFSAGKWQLPGLSEPIGASGLGLFVTADIASSATLSRTLQFDFPINSGIQVASGDDGPLDNAIANPFAQTIVKAPEVNIRSVEAGVVTTQPGRHDVLLQRLVFTNSYTSARTLTSLRFENATTGPGNPADLDAQYDLLSLHDDANHNGVLDVSDPLLGTASFVAGSAQFTGLSWSVPTGASAGLLVTGNVAIPATDGDTLAAQIASPADVAFFEPTNVTAAWPVDSSMHAAIDGMIAAEAAVTSLAPRTIGPGEGPALSLGVRVPRNGRLDDVLQSVRVSNLGTALPSDLTELRLWRDGGNGSFDQGTGDDVDLGALSPSGPDWISGPLNEGLSAPGDLLFVSTTAAPGARDSVTLRLAIPQNGLQVASGNDGPIDAALTSPGEILIAHSPLQVAIDVRPGRASVGQSLTVVMSAHDAGSEMLRGVTPSPLSVTGAAVLTRQSGPVPDSLDLASGASDTLRFQYRADGPGTASVSGGASAVAQPSATAVQSPPVSSQLVVIDRPLIYVDGAPSSTAPSLVNRGQTNVPTLLLSLANDSDPAIAAARIQGVRLSLVDRNGIGIVPRQLLDRVTVASGSQIFGTTTALDSTGSVVSVPFSTPVVIPAGQNLPLSVRVDLSSTTALTDFRVRLDDSASVAVADANSDAPAWVRLPGASYPFASNDARIVSSATELDVSAANGTVAHAGPGQPDRPLLTLELQNPGVDGSTTDAEVLGLTLTLTDSSGSPGRIFPDDFAALRVVGNAQTYGGHTVTGADGASVAIDLSPPIRVPVNRPVAIEVHGDIAGAALPGAIRLELGDSAAVRARDATSQTALAVRLAARPLAGPALIIDSRADSVAVRSIAAFTANTTIGAVNVPAWTMRLRNPGPPSSASLRVDRLTVHCADDSNRALAASSYLARLRILKGGVTVANADPMSPGDSTVLTLPGLLLAPGDTLSLDLIADVSPTAPSGFLQLFSGANDIAAFDANLNTAVTARPDAAGSLPARSGLTHLDPPPRDLRASLASLMPSVIAGDERPIRTATLSLRNPAAAGSIRVGSLSVMAADRSHQAIDLGTAFDWLEATIGGVPWAQSAVASNAVGATLTPASPLDIAAGTTAQLVIYATPRAGARGSVRLGIDSSGVVIIQPQGGLLQVVVSPEPGQSFPFWTGAAEIGATNLAQSFINFPNPFAAGHEATTIGYFLPSAGRVSLRVYTAAGDAIRTLLDGSYRAAGMYEDTHWDGRNGGGQVIRNGVYLAELVADYDDGRHERALRKIAVVR